MSDPTASVTIPFVNVKVEAKYLSLVLLVLQNCLLVLSIKYSRVHLADDGLPYVTSTAVVVSELVKFVASLVLEYVFETPKGESFTDKIYMEFFSWDTLKLSVPGILYCFQNNLLFVALSNLTVAVYQVSAQVKILTTAMFSIIMLGKQISRWQTVSLFALTIGVGIVQIAKTDSGAAPTAGNDMNQVKGMIAILSACMTSGFAGVYYEKILKRGKQVSLYIRNMQLAFFGYTIGLLTVYVSDYDIVKENGFFQGYGTAVWVVVITQACGGLLVAVVMKYADNILKGFATSVSIVISSLVSWMLFASPINTLFTLGAFLVMVAVYLYGKYPPQAPKPVYSAVPEPQEEEEDKDLEINAKIVRA